LSGCSSSSEAPSEEGSPTASAPAEKVDAIANTVPEAIKSTGTLVIGVNIPYAPNEFKDPEGKIVGFDVDLMNAIAGT
ncbi:ABC transporter substrate-binding protein, partial [Mycobacterium sp. ITM-2017-0098]